MSQSQMPPQPSSPLPSCLSPESWLLSFFPARAGGCLLVGSAHPLGSTVRLRDPAKADRQGSEPQSCHGGRAAEREGMEWSFCRFPTSSLGPSCLSSATSRVSWTPLNVFLTFFLTTFHPPCQATQLLPLHCPYTSYSHPAGRRNPEAKASPRAVVSVWLSDFLPPSISQPGKGGRKEGREHRNADSSSQSKKTGPVRPDGREGPHLCHPNSTFHPYWGPLSPARINGHTHPLPSLCVAAGRPLGGGDTSRLGGQGKHHP